MICLNHGNYEPSVYYYYNSSSVSVHSLFSLFKSSQIARTVLLTSGLSTTLAREGANALTVATVSLVFHCAHLWQSGVPQICKRNILKPQWMKKEDVLASGRDAFKRLVSGK